MSHKLFFFFGQKGSKIIKNFLVYFCLILFSFCLYCFQCVRYTKSGNPHSCPSTDRCARQLMDIGLPLCNVVFNFLSIHQSECPERDNLLRSIFNLVSNNIPVLYLRYLLFPFFTSTYFEGVFAYAEITNT